MAGAEDKRREDNKVNWQGIEEVVIKLSEEVIGFVRC